MLPPNTSAGEASTSALPAAILVVDDNADKRLSITSVLEPLGHTIVEADSGEAGLREVMERSFAVILMDVQMPGMDGYETARLIRMRSQSEHTPIIFITAHARDEAQVPVAYASGAVDFIWAPIVPDTLRAKVAIFIELHLKSRELEQSLNRLRDSEARTRSVLANVADGIVTVNDEGVIESFNRAATELFGYSEQEAIGQPFSVLVDPKHPADFAGHAEAGVTVLSARPSRRSAEPIGRRKDGSTFPMQLDLSDVPLGDRTIHIGCMRDVSERQSYTLALQHQVLHDDLTGLPNRVLFGDRVGHAIRSAMRTGESLALLVMDLDDFKQVNDTLGHQHGDALLKLVAERLVGCLRDGDTVARLGGDEFGVLPIGDTDLAGAATVVWKIQQALQPPFLVNGHAIEVKASIGITLVPEHGDNIDDLLRRADLAMYDAKRSGTGYAMFATAQEETPARRLALLGDLRRCIERNELVLHYQPKVNLATGETVGVEALIRWNHPSGRLFMPGDFMSEVEGSELMIPITEWVITEALRQLRVWRDEGYDLTMAVNLDARCLAEGAALFATVDKLTSAWGIPPDKLTLELTEGELIDTAVPGLLARLNGMDQRLSIDDFGTGYSSLVYLQRLPVAEIKADRSFVMTMASVDDDAVIVRSIIDLAHNLSVRVVAEGVEDEATMNLLIECGCDEAQGYHFSRPVPGDALGQWLATSSFGLPRRLDSGQAVAVRPAETTDTPAARRPRAPMEYTGDSQPVRVLHCDDSESYRRLLVGMLEPHAGIEIVGQVTDHADMLAQAAALQPDVVLLDLDRRGDERVIARLRDVCAARVLVLSDMSNADVDPLVTQADGFVSKNASSVEIVRAVRAEGDHGRARVVGEGSSAHDILWVGRVRRSLSDARFVLYAQPIVALATGAVARHELLIRMIGEDGQLIAPGEFLPTAERFSLSSEVDRWVIRQAAGFAAHGHGVHVNISTGTLADPDIAAYVEHELVAAGTPPALVGFEIEETALVSNEALAIAFVHRVRSLGCQVALDDFGTGYGGFSYLKSVPVASLKIDRQFVTDLLAETASEHVVSAVVHLAAGFGLETVAKGVEDQATLERLRSLGVSHAQGYHLARPAAAQEVLFGLVDSPRASA